ncbi:uncharacterized protein F4812DRAFT_456354 [Daldinia caldariorum]|uniref:uncharacterized protein n=1 Tax=Daldinia caldariorum TaxID=326644 RepID=UPI00200863B3|nr:uncharacterized protein F4812DRAFT_456354 [Daldinia caldariorum]KAI1470347.1 hypothetical protein F4812DRAFT_456354 [Daldinia caldariorum]
MTAPIPHGQISSAGSKYGLSERAAFNSAQDQPWDAIEKMVANVWAPTNPNGLVFLNVAENILLHQEVATRIEDDSTIVPNDHLGYGFQAHKPVLEKQILILPGAVAVIDSLIWSICNDGEGVIVPVPIYTGFKPAVSLRAWGVLVPVSSQDIAGYRGFDDVFAPEMNKKALEKPLLQSPQSRLERSPVSVVATICI